MAYKRTKKSGSKRKTKSRRPVKKYAASRAAMNMKTMDTYDSIHSGGSTMGLCATGTFNLLNGLYVGAGACQRVGRVVCLKSLRLSVTFQQVLACATEQWVRCAVVYDHQANGAAPTFTDVFASQGQVIGTGATVLIDSPPNIVNKDRFVVLFDKLMHLPATQATTSAAGLLAFPLALNNLDVRKTIRLRNLETRYNSAGSSGNVAEISTGALYLVVCTDNMDNTAATIRFRQNIRLSYTD